MTMQEAEQFLEQIQIRACRHTIRMYLKNAPVDVKALPGNSFRITIDRTMSGANAAMQRLNHIGAGIRDWAWPADVATAVVTWDSAVNYLAMTGDLTRAPNEEA